MIGQPGWEVFIPTNRRSNSNSPANASPALSPSHQTKVVCVCELVGHHDSVNALLQLSDTSFASCGSDNLVLTWKDGYVESARRNEKAQQMMGRYEAYVEAAGILSGGKDVAE